MLWPISFTIENDTVELNWLIVYLIGFIHVLIIKM